MLAAGADAGAAGLMGPQWFPSAAPHSGERGSPDTANMDTGDQRRQDPKVPLSRLWSPASMEHEEYEAPAPAPAIFPAKRAA
jgi:hypothetical protein